MKAPFPYFGGKSRVAADIWARFGDCPNYVEPFAGSLAVLLARPHDPRVETVNDKDGLLSNFWRAVSRDHDAVADAADWPVNECDLHARNLWLVGHRDDITARLMGDPDWFDAKAAGWWVWGACAWIGSGWCSGVGPWVSVDGLMVKRERPGVRRQLPHLGSAGMGVNRKLPHLGSAGMGVNRQLPHLGSAGMGVNRKLPHLGSAGRGQYIRDMMRELRARLRDVRVCCGDWRRVLGPSPTTRFGTTAILLDPPYCDKDRTGSVYAMDSMTVAHDVREWAIAHGDDPALRIALCGYAGEHDMPESWSVHAWKAQGGYGSQGNGSGRANASREVVWFSPHCLPATAAEPEATLCFA